MHAILLHGASAPHVHGDDPIVSAFCFAMLILATVLLLVEARGR